MNLSGSSGRMPLQIWVIPLSLAAAVVVALPSALLQGESWGARFAPWSLAPTLVLGNATAWGACLLAVAVVWHVPRRPATVPMVLFLCLGALAFGVATVGLGPGLDGTSEARITVVRRALALAFVCVASGSLMRLALCFPDEFIPESTDMRIAGSVGVRLARWSHPWLVIAATAVLCFVAELVLTRAGQVLAVLCVSMWGFGAAGVFEAQYRKGSEEDRRRILWMVQGSTLLASIPMCGFLLVMVSIWLHLPFDLEGAEPIAFALGPAALVICWTMAVFLHGAVEPALVIRRSTITGLMSLLLIFLFAGAESLISDQVSPLVGLPQTFSSAVAGGIVALAFVPLNTGLKRLADRYLPAVGGSAEPHAD